MIAQRSAPNDPAGDLLAGPLLTTDVDRMACHVDLAGDLCLATADQLTAVLAELEAGGAIHITVDLSDLRFCDGRGLAVFSSTGRRLAAVGGSLTLVEPSRLTLRILDLTGVGDLVRVVGAPQAVPA